MTKNKSKATAFFLAIIMSLTLLSGCGQRSNAEVNLSNAQAQKSQTLTLGAAADLKASAEGETLVFDTFTVFAEKMKMAPSLVESWEIKNDGKTYVLHLRKGVKFHNGQDFTADVAKFSLEYWGKYESVDYLKNLDNIKVVDTDTLEVNFKTPYTALISELKNIKATLKESVDDKGNMVEYIGTGPFKLTEYRKDQKAVLVKNTDYWNKARLPKIEQVVWQTIPDENARLMAVKSGQVDAIGVSEHYISLPYEAIPGLEKTEGLSVLKQTKDGSIATYCFNYKKGVMSDLNLRKAVAYAIDRETMVKKVLSGVPEASGHFLNPEFTDGPSKEKPYTYDLQRAKEALAAAGYKDINGDGIVEKDGKPLKLRLLTKSTKTDTDVAVFVQNNLKQAGIDMEIKALDSNQFSQVTLKGDFDIARTHPWIAPAIYYLVWRGNSDQYDKYGIGLKADAQFDALKNTALTSFDEKTRSAAWEKIWQLEYAFYPAAPLHVQPRAFVYKNNIKGFKFDPDVVVIDLSQVTIE